MPELFLPKEDMGTALDFAFFEIEFVNSKCEKFARSREFLPDGSHKIQRKFRFFGKALEKSGGFVI